MIIKPTLKLTVLISCIFYINGCSSSHDNFLNGLSPSMLVAGGQNLSSAQVEAKFAKIIGESINNLQFKSELSQIYAENDYNCLWSDKDAETQFLHNYAAFTASGISSQSAKQLELIDQSSQTDSSCSLAHDILLSEAFLDYMFYTKNLTKNAQSWLYESSYKTQLPINENIKQWLNAIKNKQHLQFIQSLTGNNKLYKQTVNYLLTANNPIELAELALNAQRLRVIPDFENGIFVNIPTYQLYYFRNGKLVLNSRVIVGRNERRTPVMYSKLSNVVVNPPWNAPVRLINEDLLPKIRKDLSYLSRFGYEILDSTGNVIDPSSIDWNTIGDRFPYQLRQKPSDNAALGRYKFNMPRSDAIYLHDTPSHELFNKKTRALSSGCVRVEKSDQLATILLREAGWTDNKRQAVLKSRKTTWANIQSDNPVYLYYVTKWVNDDKIYTAPDIYGYDKAMLPKNINWALVKKYL